MNQTDTNQVEGEELGSVVCATRGGVGSEPAVQGAIALAQEGGLRLTFLYVADVEFMKQTEMGRTALIAEEVRKMGEFIMMTLVEKAQTEGVEADYAVRQGRFREEVVTYLEEAHPAMLVMGRPQEGTARLDLDKLNRLTQEVEEETGVPVKLV
jgi:nucleotide-binding universal stress UspA family protein